MKAKSLIPLIVYLLGAGYGGYIFIPIIVDVPSMIFGGHYAGIICSWVVYWLGIVMTKPRDRKVEIKKSYFYALFLYTVGSLVYSYSIIPVVAGNEQWLWAVFIGGLGWYAVFYIAGMISANRDMQGKEVYFTQDSFSFSLLYIVPTIIISVLVCYFARHNSTILFIGTIVGVVFGAIFFYVGIAMATEQASKKTGFYKFLIWFVFWVAPSTVTLIVSPTLIQLALGDFVLLWVSFLSVIVNFLVSYTAAVIIAKKIYQLKKV